MIGPRGEEAVRRLAAIDVGTNSVRLVVAEASPDGSYRVLDDEKAVTRLGRGLAATGELSIDSMESSVVALERMKRIAQGYRAEIIRVVGTAAVRDARNGARLCELVRQRTGLVLRPISADEEARLAYLSASHAFDLSDSRVAVVDVGGGSTEVVLASRGVTEMVCTLPLGAVLLTERFAGVESPSGDHEKRYRELRGDVKRALKLHLRRPPFVPQAIYGTGGTFTTLAAVSMQRGARGDPGGGMLPFAMRGHEMQRSEVKHLLEWLRNMPVRQRLRVPGLGADRAEIIIAGAAVVEAVMKRLGVNSLRVHDRGIRDGLILTMIRELYPRLDPRPSLPADRWQGVRHFAQACRFEEAHSLHVSELALQLYDQLGTQAPESLSGCGSPADRDLLRAAGDLHDVGYFINYTKHHKHSYHLIVHSDLAGFTHRELGIIANIARYHRRAEPAARHPAYARLGAGDRRRVRVLSGVLRVADGLDRTHTQNVRSVRLRVDGARAVIFAEAQEDPSVDIWGAERKCGLFARELRLTPQFRWTRLVRMEGPFERDAPRARARAAPEAVEGRAI